MLNLSLSKAQGLSLSFNLTETDTLANMIAESKKYDITSLTLTGYVNEENTKYIKDLNTNGCLTSLDLSGVSHICTYYYKQQNYTFHYSGRPSYIWINSEIGSLGEFIGKYGFTHIPGKCGYVNHYGVNTSQNVYITIIEEHHDNMYTVTLKSSFTCPYGDGVFGSDDITKSYSINYPQLMFQDNSFSKLVLPDNIEQIGDTDCRFRVKNCNEYVLGHQVNTIGENAFKDSHIVSLDVNSTIDSIKANAFEGADGNILKNSLFLESVKNIGKNAFKNSSLLKEVNGSIALQAVKIGKNAFFNAVIPPDISLSNIEEIGDSAFMSSTIVNFDMGNNIKYLGNSTFESCGTLKSFRGGTNIEQIGKRVFYGCKQLKEFTPSNILKSIGDSAFANTSSMVEFSIPEATEKIGYCAYANSGIKELDLGNYENFHRGIIVGCDSLETITVNASNEKLKSDEGVLFTKDGKRLLAYPSARKQPLYEIGNTVVEIADSAFYGARILNSLGVGESINKIGKNAFANSNIFELKVLPSKVPALTETLGVNQQIVRLFVHEKDYSTYYIANYWGDFKNIFIIENTVSPDNIINVEIVGTLPSKIGFGNQFKYNALKLSGSLNSDDVRYLREMAGRTIDGNPTSGVLTDLDFSQASIVSGGSGYYQKSTSSSGTLTTKENIIGESMFEGCHLEKISISDNATSISAKAFSGCPLKEFLVPSGVTSIGSQAFAGATLSSFSAPAALVSISLDSFYGMGSLKEINVESENKTYLSIDNVLFTKDGTSLLLYPYGKEGEKYIIPETVTKINEQAFGGNILKVVTANEGLKEIGTLAFDNLASLEAISLPSTLERIGHRAFWGCNHLMDISCKAYYPPTLGYNSSNYFGQPYNNFSDRTYENAVLLVPEKNGGYKSRSGWKLFNNTIESDDWMTGIITTRGIGEVRVEKYYDMSGREVKSMPHGINIVKMSDGSTRKVMVK